MAVDMNAVRERIRVEQERRREALAWFEHRRTMQILTLEQQKRHDEYLKANPDLPF